MQHSRRLRKLWLGGVSVASAALILAACGSSPSSNGSTTSTPTSSKPVHGGTAYFAEAPAAVPNWIFPFASLAYFSVANLTQFQYLMYRPLYWFGQVTTAAPTVDYSLSLANAPVWSNGNKTVTITLKGWKFHDGQTVDAQSVIFWLNMMKAEPTEWAGTVPGLFPYNVKSYSTPSATSDTVTLNLTGAYNTTWYLYNQLSEIDPLANALDVTSLTGAPGSGGCSAVSSGPMTGASTMKACAAVWKFDTDNNGQSKSPQMAGDTSTYGSNKLWNENADGPWLLQQFNASNGRAQFVPNPTYSGPQKPYLNSFVELPYTQDTTEFAALEAGGSGAPDVGYVPSQDIPQYTGKPGSVGTNVAALQGKYTLVTVEPWQINYFPFNFNSNTVVGNGTLAAYIFRQTYIRQAMQSLVNQTAMITAVDKGYGVPTYGPVPLLPKSSFLSSSEATNPLPFSYTAAENLLKSHDWKINSGGTDVCTKGGASGCGANIATGTPLKLNEVYASGTASITTIVNLETSAWSKVGINVSTKPLPFDQVIGQAVPCAITDHAKCGWEMLNWGGGWIYSPDYEPTGEEIFATGAGSNSGNYNNAENNTLIHETNVGSSASVFSQWETFLAKQVPVIWQPVPLGTDEIINNLHGATPINALLNLTPEYWWFSKS
jgi:peptide/nickel transport system substrate-binding protein